jgi:uroporphyrinogen III methyltransferase/synthase
MKVKGVEPAALAPSPLAAVGPKTADAVRRKGLRVEVVPGEFVAEGLLAALKGRSVEGSEILIPRAQEAREVLVEELEKRGARVTVAPVYRTVRADESRGPLISALEKGVDMVTFTASSTVRHFMDLLGPGAGDLLRGAGIACIGRITADTARERGLAVDLVPRKSTVADLAEAIAGFLLQKPPQS